jgi:hypothetical protein
MSDVLGSNSLHRSLGTVIDAEGYWTMFLRMEHVELKDINYARKCQDNLRTVQEDGYLLRTWPACTLLLSE